MNRVCALILAALVAGAAFAEEAPPVDAPEVEPPPPDPGPDLTTEPDLVVLLDAARTAAAIELLPGLAYRVVELPAFGLKVHAWTFDQARFQAKAVEQKEPTGSPVADLIGDGVLAINGGFFERDKQGVLSPSGLLIIDGVVVAPEHERAGSGIVFVDGNGVGIGYRKDLTDRSAMRQAIQVGPILVDRGGRVGVLNTRHDRQKRSAICLKPGAFAIFAVEGGLSLFQLASLLAQPETEGGLGCDVALNLDGGPSTQVEFPDPLQPVAITGWPVENALVVSANPE